MEKTDIKKVSSKAITLRDTQVIIDRDVAGIYGVTTRRVNEAVKNSPVKFPEGYVLELSDGEKKELVENFDRFEHLKHSTAMPHALSSSSQWKRPANVRKKFEHHSSRGGSSLKIYRQTDAYPGPPCCFLDKKTTEHLFMWNIIPIFAPQKGSALNLRKYRQYFIQGHRESTRNSGLPLCGYGLFGDNPSGCTGGSPLLLTRNIIRPDRL